MRIITTTTFIALPTLLCPLLATASPILPNDPSVSGSLVLWAREAGTNFDGTTWIDSSGNGNDLILPVGTSPAFTSPTVPTASTFNATTGAFAGQNVDGILFSDSANDLLGTDLTTGSTLSEVTVFLVYSSDANGAGESSVRPGGIGSPSALTGDVNNFHLAADGSLRYDNGNNTGADDPADELLVRAARFDSGIVTNWQFTGGTTNITIGPVDNGGSAANNTSSDQFFLGDVRTGSTSSVAGGGLADSDVFVSAAIVYTGALTDDQVEGIIDFLTLSPVSDPSAIPEPGSALVIAAAVGMLSLRRRRGQN
ncbi:MAG: PEP-CTERM sorting domain-containing protein [Planctomycetota bacterium]